MFLGQAEEVVTRQYFEASVYRNILDMLNTLESVAQKTGNIIAATSVNTVGQLYKSSLDKGTRGAAINAVGKASGPGGEDTYYWWARRVALASGLKFSGNPMGPTDVAIQDLLNLSRSINWEMNRVHLPIPKNFRQFLDKFSTLQLKFIPVKANPRGGIPTSGSITPIHLIEAMNRIKQLKDSIIVMRGEVRIAIDKAGLEVQEETLRRESEALKNDAQLLIQIDAEKQRIEQEKIDYQNRINQEIANRQIAIEATPDTEQAIRWDSEIKQLTEQKQVAESVAVNQEKNLITIVASTGEFPVLPPVEKTVENSYKGTKIVPLAAGLLTLYSMFG